MPFPTNVKIVVASKQVEANRGTVNLGPNALSAAIINAQASPPTFKVKVRRKKDANTVVALGKIPHARGQQPSQNFVYRALNTFHRIMATVTPPRIFTSNPLETATTKLHKEALALLKKPDGIRDDAAVKQTGADLQEVQELAQKPKVVSLLDMVSSILKTTTARLPVKVARVQKRWNELTQDDIPIYNKNIDIYKPLPPAAKPPPPVNTTDDVALPPPPLNQFGALNSSVPAVRAMGSAAKRNDPGAQKAAAKSYHALKVGIKTSPAGRTWLNEVAQTLMRQAAYDVERGAYITT